MRWRGCVWRSFPTIWLWCWRDSISISIWWPKPRSMTDVSSPSNWIYSNTRSRVYVSPRTWSRMMRCNLPSTSSINWVVWSYTLVQQIVGITTPSFRSVRRMYRKTKSGTPLMISLSPTSTRRISSQRGTAERSNSTPNPRCWARINPRMPTYYSMRGLRSRLIRPTTTPPQCVSFKHLPPWSIVNNTTTKLKPNPWWRSLRVIWMLIWPCRGNNNKVIHPQLRTHRRKLISMSSSRRSKRRMRSSRYSVSSSTTSTSTSCTNWSRSSVVWATRTHKSWRCYWCSTLRVVWGRVNDYGSQTTSLRWRVCLWNVPWRVHGCCRPSLNRSTSKSFNWSVPSRWYVNKSSHWLKLPWWRSVRWRDVWRFMIAMYPS